jgi:RNA polymerase sigma-70 factor (family 1)
MVSQNASNKQPGSHNLVSMGLDGAPAPAGMAKTWDDKEFFLKKAFEEDPRKGCELLFKHYYKALCNHAVRMVYSKSAAEDIVAELFCFFWTKQLHLHITTSYRAYLFTAVRNRCLKYLAKEFLRDGSRQELPEAEVFSALPTPYEIMHVDELMRSIESTIKKLAPQCQRVFLMSRMDGKKYQEIADGLGIAVKTVEAHMSKALESIRMVVRKNS